MINFSFFKVIDLETTGLEKRDGAEIFSYCIGHHNGEVDIFRYGREKQAKEFLQGFLFDTRHKKIAHNLKFEYRFITQSGFQVPENTEWHDTMIMHQLLRNLCPSHTIDFLAQYYFRYKIHYKGKTYDAAEIDVKVSEQAKERDMRYDFVDEDLMDIYQFSDGQREMLIFMLLYPIIMKPENRAVYLDYLNEIELIKTTIRIEDYGIKIDKKNTIRLRDKLENDFILLSNKVKKSYGEYYNLSSENQLKHLLFNVLKYPTFGNTKKGNPSTNKDILFEMKEAYPDDIVFDHILQWRAIKNGITLTKKYLKLTERRDYIHTTLNQNKARTGRPSSSDPPLQNIAKASSMKNPFAVPMRSCFCVRPKRLLWFADYKGIEMVLIIERSNCENMKKRYLAGEDVHQVAMMRFYGMDDPKLLYLPDGKEKTLDNAEFKKYRDAAKTVHFALPYGMKPDRASKTLHWPQELVDVNLLRYAEEFPEIFYFSQNMLEKVKKIGHVITPFGRKLWVPPDNMHAAADYDIQGTAAGIMKRGTVGVDRYIREELNDEIRIVMTIYDELIFCAPDYNKNDKKIITDRICMYMCTMPEIGMPLKIEWKESRTTWNDAKEMEF